MAIGHEQRQRQEAPDRAQQDAQARAEEALQKVDEGQEISPELAEQLQPQLGNAALASLLARSGPDSARADARTPEEGEERVEGEEEEELKREEIEAPLFGGGGGGGGGGPADPWDMGKLFGGEDDGDSAGGGGSNPRLRASPIRPGEGTTEDEDPPPEEDPEAVPARHHAAVDEALLEPDAADGLAPVARQGDAVHAAVEAALLDPARVARQHLEPEQLVDRSGAGSPLGRSLAIGRFLGEAATEPRARALGRALAEGAASLLVPRAGATAAATRLAALAVSAQAAEGGGSRTDRAVALALVPGAWDRALVAARELAARRRLHAPQIAAQALGHALSEAGGQHLGELAPDSLGGRALHRMLPAGPRLSVPDLASSAPPALQDDEALAAVDALLESLSGGEDPSALPAEPTVDAALLQPILDAASALVNALGRTQVELATAGIAACSVVPEAPVRAALTHGDRALRLLAREVVAAGDGLVGLRGRLRTQAEPLAAAHVGALREALAALEALRAWALGVVAAAATGGGSAAAPPAVRPRDAQLASLLDRAQARRDGADRAMARTLLSQALDRAQHQGETGVERDTAFLLGAACLETGDRSGARQALARAFSLAGSPAPDTWTRVAAGPALAALLLDLGELDAAAAVAADQAQAARSRVHWLALTDAHLTQAVVAGAGSLEAALDVLLAALRELHALGARVGIALCKAHLSELRATHGEARFDPALQAALQGAVRAVQAGQPAGQQAGG